MSDRVRLNVLIACEESQAECEAFRALGHKAFSCDIQPCRRKGHPEWHIQADVTPYLMGLTTFRTQDGEWHGVTKWHLIIAHPPCTYMCKVGSPWLYKNPDWHITINGEVREVNFERWQKVKEAKQFFMQCLNATADFVAVENPIPMRVVGLPKPDCYVDPSWFGVKYTKKTLYWLKNLPPIFAGTCHPNPKCYVTASRGKYRSRTFPALANAIAEQWSEFIVTEIEESRYHV